MILTPAFPLIATSEGYATLGVIQLPKYRSGGTDTLSRTGSIFGTPPLAVPPMTAVLRSQMLAFS